MHLGAVDGPVVDAHTHVFNVDDLCVAGFLENAVLRKDLIDKWFPAPELVGWVLAHALDLALQGRAPGSTEADRLQAMLDGDAEALDTEPPPPPDTAELFLATWKEHGLVSLTDSRLDLVDQLVAAFRRATAAQRAEVLEWLAELGYSDDASLLEAGRGGVRGLLEVGEALLTSIIRVTRFRYEIAAELCATYPEVDLVFPMLVDFEHVTGDPPATPVREQIRIHSLLSKVSMKEALTGAPRSTRLHPFVGFDPHRKDGLDLVRSAVEEHGFIGVKIYPATGFRPSGNRSALDDALHALYAWCVDHDVPVLAHAAHSNGFQPAFNDYGGPTGWKAALADHPGLRLCFGHFGHLHPGEGSFEDSWAAGFCELIDAHDHVYADLGNSLLALPGAPAAPGSSERYRTVFRAMVAELLEQDPSDPPKRVRRLLYASDWWFNGMRPAHEGYYEAFRDGLDGVIPTEQAPVFYGGNALRYLGFVKEDGQPDVDNQNRERLLTFYEDLDGAKPPPWLVSGTA